MSLSRVPNAEDVRTCATMCPLRLTPAIGRTRSTSSWTFAAHDRRTPSINPRVVPGSALRYNPGAEAIMQPGYKRFIALGLTALIAVITIPYWVGWLARRRKRLPPFPFVPSP